MLDFKDGDTTYSSFFALMARSDDEEEDKITLFDIKQNLNDYNPKNLRKLITVLIDSLCDLTVEKDLL